MLSLIFNQYRFQQIQSCLNQMRRTVFHTSKPYLTDPFNQPSFLFPYLDSKLVQTYAKSIIQFKRVHAMCNVNNIESVVPLPAPSRQYIFFGRSNVGKSTLLNKLLQRDVAAMSKRPGKTKELLFCQVGSNSISDQKMIQSKLYFVDAPGYGFATGVSKSQINQWGKLIKSYLLRTKQNALNQRILCLIDITHGLKQTDALMLQMMHSLSKHFQIVFTKCDKFEYSPDNQNVKKGLEIATTIQEKYKTMNFYAHFTSCRMGLGIDQLRNHLMFDIVSNKV